jgi:hypothetical protein
MRFSTLFFVLVPNIAVLSLVHPPSTRTRDKTAVFSTGKKHGEKKFNFFLLNK